LFVSFFCWGTIHITWSSHLKRVQLRGINVHVWGVLCNTPRSSSKTFPLPQKRSFAPITQALPTLPATFCLRGFIYSGCLFHKSGSKQFVTFCVCFLLLNLIFSRFIHVMAYIRPSFRFMNSPHFLYSFIYWRTIVRQTRRTQPSLRPHGYGLSTVKYC
jgi:hypothetical protein